MPSSHGPIDSRGAPLPQAMLPARRLSMREVLTLDVPLPPLKRIVQPGYRQEKDSTHTSR